MEPAEQANALTATAKTHAPAAKAKADALAAKAKADTGEGTAKTDALAANAKTDALAANAKADALAAKAKADALRRCEAEEGDYEYDSEIEALLARHAANKRSKRGDTHGEGEVKGANKEEGEAEEEEEEKAKTKQRSEEDEAGDTGARSVRIIHKKIYEDMLTVAEFEELEAAEGDPNCTREIFMKMWRVYLEDGVEVTRYLVLATTVTEGDTSIPEPSLQDLFNACYPGDPNPPNTINIVVDYPDLEEESAGGLAAPGSTSLTTRTSSA
jgi:hypothetical protein